MSTAVASKLVPNQRTRPMAISIKSKTGIYTDDLRKALGSCSLIHFDLDGRASPFTVDFSSPEHGLEVIWEGPLAGGRQALVKRFVLPSPGGGRLLVSAALYHEVEREHVRLSRLGLPLNGQWHVQRVGYGPRTQFLVAMARTPEAAPAAAAKAVCQCSVRDLMSVGHQADCPEKRP